MHRKIKTIKSVDEALARSLALAIMARTGSRYREAVIMAESFAAGMPERRIERAKAKALRLVAEWQGANRSASRN